MGVWIRGMTMPQKCCNCKLCTLDNCGYIVCRVSSNNKNVMRLIDTSLDRRQPWCPLVSVSEWNSIGDASAGLVVGWIHQTSGESKKHNNVDKLKTLIFENPDLPVLPIVESYVSTSCDYWLGEWDCKVTEFYEGRNRLHFKDDDEEDVLDDMVGCEWEHDSQGRWIYDLTDDEWDALYQSIPWTKCIAVYITPTTKGKERK